MYSYDIIIVPCSVSYHRREKTRPKSDTVLLSQSGSGVAYTSVLCTSSVRKTRLHVLLFRSGWLSIASLPFGHNSAEKRTYLNPVAQRSCSGAEHLSKRSKVQEAAGDNNNASRRVFFCILRCWLCVAVLLVLWSVSALVYGERWAPGEWLRSTNVQCTAGQQSKLKVRLRKAVLQGTQREDRLTVF